MHRTRIIAIFVLASLPLGCASWQSANPVGVNAADAANDTNDTNDAAQRHSEPLASIALDFAKALQQLEPLRPAGTTVHFSSASRADQFTLSMQSALQDAGYGSRWVSNNAGGQLFQYRHEQEGDPRSGFRDTYEVAVGSVELRRSYFNDGQTGIKPVTPLYIRGAEASHIVLDDTHFTAPAGAPALNTEAGSAPLKAAIPKPTVRAASGVPLSVPDAANPLDLLVSGNNRRQHLTLPLTTLARVENVFELGASNYEDLLASHQVMRELVLMFPNDSLRLGDVNKRLVEQMVRYYQPESDVFSVIGCSLGPTQLKSGNAALALGRASRVREALLFAGIPQDRILDEGCWAGDSSDNTLPRRGVVVTLNRQV